MYDVEYSQSTFLELPSPVTVGVDGTNMSATISGLEEYVEYSISVAAYTVIGEGPFSLPVQDTTLQDSQFFRVFYFMNPLTLCSQVPLVIHLSWM